VESPDKSGTNSPAKLNPAVVPMAIAAPRETLSAPGQLGGDHAREIRPAPTIPLVTARASIVSRLKAPWRARLP